MMRIADEYEEVIALLKTLGEEEQQRKLHRLPLEQYTMSDCEFFFTICARHHQRPFTDPILARQIIDALLWYRNRHSLRLFCYCLMPDHLHFILKLPDSLRRLRHGGARGIAPEGILDWVGDFKSYTTNQCWWKRGGTNQLWQKSSYDHVIRCNDSVEKAVNYTLRNPERKGLVEDWQDYPYAAIIDEW
ncbi:MAG: transposase [Armatimonadota bacterium]